MKDVAIIGAGEVGGLLAHVLARRDTAAEIRLIDESGRVAAGKALDITLAGEEYIARLLKDPRTPVAVSSRGLRMLRPDHPALALALLKRLNQLRSGVLLLGAGPSHRELIERGVREIHIARGRLLGSAPEALAAALRAMIALEIDGSPQDVALSIAGVPPSQIVVAWDDVTIGGFAATRVLDEPTRRRLAARLPSLWPPGPYALASAAANARATEMWAIVPRQPRPTRAPKVDRSGVRQTNNAGTNDSGVK